LAAEISFIDCTEVIKDCVCLPNIHISVAEAKEEANGGLDLEEQNSWWKMSRVGVG
jgi:hypothetical protein